jgi:SAM-dependent methyltransferase
MNAEVWSRGAFVEDYTGTALKQVEQVLIERHRRQLGGRVLELGCGAGRATGHLIDVADHVTGLDISVAMVEHCRVRYPQATFGVADIRDLSALEGGSFDAVLALANVIDVLGHEERARVLAGLGRLLAPGALLIFSSHNLAYAPRIPPPLRLPAAARGLGPRGLARELLAVPRRVRNRRRLHRFEVRADDHAVLVDEAHDYSLLHYYVSRDGQARALERAGFELVEALDTQGRPVAPGEAGAGSSELHYVARISR